MIKYTFLLPAFKPDFLEVALRSIKSQTFKDFKVLVSDDCSPHDLKSIYNKVCGDDARFSFRRNEVNMGRKSLVSHWNLLVDMCDTEYFILASDDDVYEPAFLEEVDKLAKKYPEVDLIRARCKILDEKRKTELHDLILPELVDSLEFVYYMYLPNTIKCIANYAFRLDALKAIGGFIDFPLAWFSDRATVMKLSAHGVANTKDVLFSFRMSDVNITFGKNDEKKAYTKEYATQLYDQWFKDFMEPFEKKEESLNAYQRGLYFSAIGEHNKLIKDETVRYLPNLSVRHFWEYLKKIDARLFKFYCLLVYIKTKIKG